jgi:predicted Zn-dependent peptidase
VREERGLAYSIWSERSSFEETGSMCVMVGTAVEHVDEVLRIVVDEIDLLADQGISARELDIAKGNLRAETLLSNEDSGARMNRLGASLLLHGEVLSVDEVLTRLDAVELEEVHGAARELARSTRTLAAVGPFDSDAFDPQRLGLG